MAITHKDQKCVDDMVNATGIPQAEARKILRTLGERAKERTAKGRVEAFEKSMLEDAHKMTEAAQFDALQLARQEALKIIATRKVLNFVEKFTGSPGEALISFLGGTTRGKANSRLSIDYKGKHLSEASIGRIGSRMQEKNLWVHFINDTKELELAQELAELRKRDGGKPGISKDKDALEMAKIVHQEVLLMNNRKGLAGAVVKHLEGFIVNQTHNMHAIRRAAWELKITDRSTWAVPAPEANFEKWFADIMPNIDRGRTFGDMTDAEVRVKMRENFGDFSTGDHYRLPEGEKNLRDRSLHFKTAEGWLNYNKKYGAKTVSNSIMASLERAGRDIALMEDLGPSPKAALDTAILHLRDKHAGDLAALGSLKDIRIQNTFNNIDGTTKIPHNPTVAEGTSYLKITQTLSKLGGSAVHSITDLADTAAELRRHGVPLLEAYRRTFQHVLAGRGTAEQNRIARSAGVAINSLKNSVQGRWGIQDDVPRTMAKMQSKLFTWNGQIFWDDAMQRASSNIIANLMGDNAHLPLSKLHPKEQKMLSLYGVTPLEWDHFRKGVWEGEDGAKFLTPDNLRNSLTEAEVQKTLLDRGDSASPQNVERYYNGIETKFGAYLSDRVDFAVPKPGASEMAYLNLGMRPGEPGRVAMDLMGQFKGFMVAKTRKGTWHDFHMSKGASLTDRSVGIGHIIGMGAVLGFMGYAITDFLRGKKPKDPTDPRVWVDSIIKGGGGTIYGDYVLGEFNKTGRSALGAIAGPSIGQVDAAFDILTKMRRKVTGQPNSDVGSEIFNQTLNNTPFANLFYTRLAMDYLVLWSIQENMNPGSLRRREALLKKDWGQEYLEPLTPSEAVENSPTEMLLSQ